MAHTREFLCASLTEARPSARPPRQELAVRNVEGLEKALDVYHASFAPLFLRAQRRNWAR
ncbi:MAG: hypothetical protein JWO59_3550 [Chloroflexi bacterium]|nr:hypothetical protein [Chloroflexota bacterium]